MSEPVRINLDLDDPFNRNQFGDLNDQLTTLPIAGQGDFGDGQILRPVINTPGGLTPGGSNSNPAAFTEVCTNSCYTCGCKDELVGGF